MTDMAGMLPEALTHPLESHPLLMHKSAEVMIMASCVPALLVSGLPLLPQPPTSGSNYADSNSLTDIQSMLLTEELYNLCF